MPLLMAKLYQIVRRLLSAHLLTDDRGSALIEVAVLAPVAAVLFIAMTDCSFAVQQGMVVIDAAASGTRYALSAGNATDTAGMKSAAQATAAGIPNFTAVASNYCSCSPAGSTVDCTSTCASGVNPAEYATVKTSATVPLFFKIAGYPSTFVLSGASSMRVSWGPQ